ncbi:MAG: DUF1893 domain-containing protein [Halanaerobiales bacterium]|nr:DUF1893 domain-containing protein [Halanaerobiales bacterium]
MNDKKLAINKLKKSEYKLVVVKDNEIKYKSREDSVSSIMDLLDENPELLKNSIVADKVIGRAVAMICDCGEVEFCYGTIISNGALDVFKNANIPYEANQKVEYIKNKDNTDLCPIEKLTLKVDNSSEGIEKIKEFLNKK